MCTQRNPSMLMEKRFECKSRAATANFLQARPPQWQPHQRRAAAAGAAFYSTKSRQGLGLGGLASRGGPEEVVDSNAIDKSVFI